MRHQVQKGRVLRWPDVDICGFYEFPKEWFARRFSSMNKSGRGGLNCRGCITLNFAWHWKLFQKPNLIKQLLMKCTSSLILLYWYYWWFLITQRDPVPLLLFSWQHSASTASFTSVGSILQRRSLEWTTMTWACWSLLIATWRSTSQMWFRNSKVPWFDFWQKKWDEWLWKTNCCSTW